MATERPPGGQADTARGASSLNVLAGFWLIASAFFFGLNGQPAAVWNTFIVGIVVVVFASIRAAKPRQTNGLSWINFLLGVWLFVSPWVFHYTYMPSWWNSIVLGIVVGVLGLFSALSFPARPSPMP
jgi:hypothetical protein